MKKWISLISVAAAVASCGPDLGSVEENQTDDPGVNEPANNSEDDYIRLRPSFRDVTETAFTLAPATDYSITIDNCDSGFNQTFTAADGGTRLLKFDDNCTVDLTSMLVNGITYDFSNGDAVAFPNLDSGSQAVMTNTLGTGEAVSVIIVSTISDNTSQVEAADSIEFAFSEIDQAADVDITTEATEGRFDFTVAGAAVPNFTFEAADLTLTGIQAVDGAGLFTIKLECAVAVSGGTLTDTCDTNAFQDLEFTFGAHPNPGNTLTRAEVDTFFSGGTTAVALGNVVDQSADADIANGGLTLNVTSPAGLANNTDLLLGVRETSASSARVFPMAIDFTNP